MRSEKTGGSSITKLVNLDTITTQISVGGELNHFYTTKFPRTCKNTSKIFILFVLGYLLLLLVLFLGLSVVLAGAEAALRTTCCKGLWLQSEPDRGWWNNGRISRSLREHLSMLQHESLTWIPIARLDYKRSNGKWLL